MHWESVKRIYMLILGLEGLISSFSAWRYWEVERDVSQEAEIQSYNFNVRQTPIVSSGTSASNYQIAGE